MSALGLFALMTVAHGQAPIAVNEEVLKSVMRNADSFSLKEEALLSIGGYKAMLAAQTRNWSDIFLKHRIIHLKK